MKNEYKMHDVHFEKHPRIGVKDFERGLIQGNDAVFSAIAEENARHIVMECYPGVDTARLRDELVQYFPKAELIFADDYALTKEEVGAKIRDFMTDDRVFGIMSHFVIDDFYPEENVARLRKRIAENDRQVVVYGFGASRFFDADLVVYLDRTRHGIKTDYKKGLANWKAKNHDEEPLKKEKRGFFFEWRTADRLKKKLLPRMDYYVAADDIKNLRMTSRTDYFKALETATRRPFSMVPFFMEGVWGGQWMKAVCDLDKDKKNYAWCFNGIMEENALAFDFDGGILVTPAINLVFFYPVELLGNRVHARFGTEFPIRFDFLDTMEGGNLSLQIHPLTEYIQDTFGMHYTQDESYYILDSRGGGVYLGLKEDVDKEAMIKDLRRAEKGEISFPAEKYVNKYPAKKHDHISIPAGTIHCSMEGTMVLEISATPYIFTFKMWDWGRVDLDGKPRPIHLDHAIENIQWDRTTSWVEQELLNPFATIKDADGILEEKTGLHEREFIETRRHTAKEKVLHQSHGSVDVLMLVEGTEAVVESPLDAFAPFVVRYAETFIVPENVKEYTVRPHGESAGETIKTIKAFVRV